MSVLSIKDLQVDFIDGKCRHAAVRGIELNIDAGEIVALVGESGSGKSVTAAALMGLLPRRGTAVRGSVRFGERELLGLPEAALNRVRGQGIGMIFQNPLSALDPSFRVGQQLVENLRHQHRLKGAAARAEAHAWLERVGIHDPARVLRAYPHQLSGGMRQRVMIALALLSRPALLIADEPTTALDATVQKQILDLLLDINRRYGTAILIITHDFGVVSWVSQRVAVMQAGQVVEQGPTRALLQSPQHPYTQRLIASVPDLGARLANPGPGRRLGRADVPLPAPVPRPQPLPLLQLKGLSKTFSSGAGWWRGRHQVQAVQQVDLEVYAGEILGLIGESGSGKSTLGRLIAQLLPASAGTLTFNGQRLPFSTAAEHLGFCQQLQYVFQDSNASLNPRRTVLEQLSTPALRLGLASNHSQARDLAVQALERVGLQAEQLHRYPHAFSGGQRQRIGIARALVVQPKVIILDEPTSALDVSIQAQILNLLLELREQLDLTYLFIGHNLPVIEFLCDRVAVMQRGRIVETFAAQNLLANAHHPYTQTLLASVLPVRPVAQNDSQARHA
ncbi:dipeptide ABC transporter ATP-binding protein [Pseudomonas typographi]|uniref:dipeptide ABC transporter ATP-binding protein n=1 Tax=Pseudomonas typographi TaxID=2715964 RepID=UPI001684FC6D|nr:ABC transporter ATP-binding protein [Pseudomonas typographi]MBD1586198.1 ABC transporter ATP-binding protein [Pseudomonas typographi]